MSPSVVVVIPAYNEDLAIRETIEDYVSHFPEARLVVVDNNSSDGTAAEIEKRLRPGIDVYLFEAQQGKGFATKRGLSRLEADIYILTDGDKTYRGEDARRLYEMMLQSRADMLVGDRLSSGRYKEQNDRSGHSFGNWMLSRVISILAGKRYNDVLSGLRLMSQPFVDTLDIESKGFSLETELNINAAYLKADVIEEPIHYETRPNGSESKLNTIRDGTKILYFAFINWIVFAPLQFFSMLAAAAAIASVSIGMVLLNLFITDGAITATSTAVLAASLGIVGLISFFTGLTLAVTGWINRRHAVSSFLTAKRRWNTKLDSK